MADFLLLRCHDLGLCCGNDRIWRENHALPEPFLLRRLLDANQYATLDLLYLSEEIDERAVCITLGPTFFAAGIYVTLSKMYVCLPVFDPWGNPERSKQYQGLE